MKDVFFQVTVIRCERVRAFHLSGWGSWADSHSIFWWSASGQNDGRHQQLTAQVIAFLPASHRHTHPHTTHVVLILTALLSTGKQFPLSKLKLLASRKEKQRRSLVADQHIRRENSNEMTWIELNFVHSFIWKTSGKLRQWKFQLVNSMKVKKRIRKRRKDFEWGTTSADPRAGNWPKLIERPCLFDAEASLACGRSNIQWKIKKRLQRRTGEPDRAAHRQVSRWRFHFAAKKS